MGAQEKVERQGADAVPRQQKDEGSSAQEPANVREAEGRGARVSVTFLARDDSRGVSA